MCIYIYMYASRLTISSTTIVHGNQSTKMVWSTDGRFFGDCATQTEEKGLVSVSTSLSALLSVSICLQQLI